MPIDTLDLAGIRERDAQLSEFSRELDTDAEKDRRALLALVEQWEKALHLIPCGAKTLSTLTCADLYGSPEAFCARCAALALLGETPL